MTAPNPTAADFLSALWTLMPPGRAWNRDPASEQTAVLMALAPSFARLASAANALLVDGFPSTSTQLLPDWEGTLGLPDPCAGPAPTLQGRRSQAAARFAATGGQSAAYFVTLAQGLGYTITVSEFTPFRMGQQAMGQPLGSADWAYTWATNAPLTTVTNFRMGVSGMGEPLQSFGNAVLQCEIGTFAPAHTAVLYQYH